MKLKQNTKVKIKMKPKKKNTNQTSITTLKTPRKIVRFRSPESRQYFNSLVSPFDEKSYGVRVPDQYAVDTQTYSIHKNLTVTTDSSGNADVLFVPNTGMYCMSSRSSVITGTAWVSCDAATAGQWQGITPSSLASKLVNHRIVSYGLRVFSTASMTNNQGRLLIATIPIENWLNNNDASLNAFAIPTDANKTKATTYDDYGIAEASGTVDVTSTDQYPNHMAYSMVELAESTVEVQPKVISAKAFDFRKSSTSIHSPSPFVTSQTISSNLALGGTVDALRIDGHESVLITLSGGATSTASLDIELIMHIEGAINVSTTSSSSGLTSSTNLKQAVDPLGLLEALAAAAVRPNIQTVSNAVSKTYGEFKKLVA